jgi:hypothetical protein
MAQDDLTTLCHVETWAEVEQAIEAATNERQGVGYDK